jgi:pyrroline-5-carboxylate reductase
MSASQQILAILGCGTMGEAILAGLLRAAERGPERIVATARRAEAARAIAERHGVRATTDNVAACRDADVVLVAFKPQRMRDLLDDDAMRAALSGKLLVSIAAGVRIATLSRWLPQTTVIRAMPNTPCLVGEGMTVLAPGATATAEHVMVARRIFESVGRVVELDDKHMDAVTSLNGSGPAFVYVMLEALADGGVMMGLPRGVALEIAAQVFLGAARMVLETGHHPAALKDEVTTPAGSTIAGLLTMEDGRIRSVLARAIQEATGVAAALGRPAVAPDDADV